MSVLQKSQELQKRQSAIAHRHEKLGAELVEWGGVGTAYDYTSQSTEDEHDAIRERVGVFDVTGLNKKWVEGTDAISVLNHACVRDVSKLVDGQAGYTVLLTDEGTIHDDAIIYRFNAEKFLFVSGTGQAEKYLTLSANGKECTVRIDDDVQDLAVQGPDAVKVIDAICDDDLTALGMFRHMETTINGHEVIVSRTGFTGERGYEIYCNYNILEEIYDTVLEAGKPYDIMTTGFDCLDKVRIESALLFYPYDMDETTTIWEVGLDWTVPSNKSSEYRGRTASELAKGKEKVHVVGIKIDHNDMVSDEAVLLSNGEKVGRITSPVWSHRMKESIALAQVNPGFNAIGTILELKDADFKTSATVSEIAFYDPEKKRLRG